jgi:hypothetical protein
LNVRETASTDRANAPSRWIDAWRLSCAAAIMAAISGCSSGARDRLIDDPVDAPTSADAGEPSTSSGETDPTDADAPAAPGLRASVTYPFLLRHGSTDYFPTVFAHLLGQTLDWNDISTSLACFTLENPTDSPVDITIRVDLVGYSTPLKQSVTVAAKSTSSPCINPTPALDALYQLNSPIPGQVHATATSTGAASSLLDDVHPVTITTGETVFEGKQTSSGTNVPLYRDQAVLSMPKDPAVQALLAPAAQKSAWGTFGAGGYGMHLDAQKNPIPRLPVTRTVANGGFQFDVAYFTAGESMTLGLDAVTCASCSAPTTDFYVFNQTQFSQLSSSSQEGALADMPPAVVVALDSAPGRQFTITAPADGAYYFVFVNGAADGDARDVTYHRTGTQADTPIDALQSIYEELQSFGITYDSVAFSFFDPSSTESVRRPASVLTDRAANCIDGSMLFASVLEALQLEPVVVFVPGHAYVAVRNVPGAQLVWPVETTMLGTAPFVSALLEGIGEYQDPAISHLAEMDIKAARLAGLLPIPE